MTTLSRYALFGLLTACPIASNATAVGALYTQSNAPGINKVLIFERLPDGSLQKTGDIATGGAGTGTGLGNQGALVLSGDQSFLFVVNAGDNSISSFRITASGLVLTDHVASGGTRPVSLTEDRGRLFVLNAGDDTNAGNVSGFKVLGNGTLTPIAGAVQPLSDANTGPAQIQFATDGRHVIVTEKATNRILSYRVRTNGVPDPAVINASAGQTPFGFALGNRAQLFVSDAAGGAPNASSLSSYRLRWDGQLQTLSPAVSTTQTAACWVAITPDERFAFTTNAGSGSISSYRIDLNGTVKLAEAAAADTGAGSGPIDMAMSPDGRFLYTLDGGTDSIFSHQVSQFGKLTPRSVRHGIPDGANGLAVR